MPIEEGENYHVDRVPQVNQQIHKLLAKAELIGRRQEVIDALKFVIQQLTANPLGWGDPEYRTRKKGGNVCHGIRVPLVVHYVVFEPEREVTILTIKALPGSQLD